MAIEYFCRGCRMCRIDCPEDIDDGLCPHCANRRDFPKPPPMRVGDGVSKASKLGFYLFMCVFCFAWGIFCGMKMGGA